MLMQIPDTEQQSYSPGHAFAAKAARLRFILNVCINSEKEIVQAFAGHPEKAHYEGCEFVKNLLKVRERNRI